MKIEIGVEILSARIEENITQKTLAKRMGTKQPSIARVERGAISPTINFLQKVAKAMKRKWLIALIKNDPRITSIGTHTTYSL